MVTNRKKNKRIMLVVIGLLTLIFVTGYSSVIYAASGTNSKAQINDRGILDPFSLSTIVLTSDDETVSRPPIRITTRPVLRSYFRPPLVF